MKPIIACCFVYVIFSALALRSEGQPSNAIPAWIRTKERLTIVSANDGQAHTKAGAWLGKPDAPLTQERTNLTQDSITVVHLGPDDPPMVKTVYDTVPSTILGAPYLAMSPDGRYGFVTCHTFGLFQPEAGDVLSVVDLESPALAVIQTIKVPTPTMALMHPNGTDVIAGYAKGFRVFEWRENRLVLKKDNALGEEGPESFALNPKGDRIVAAVTGDNRDLKGVYVFSYRDGLIEKRHEVKVPAELGKFDQPFSPRLTPDGSRVLFPNGGGMAKIPLDVTRGARVAGWPALGEHLARRSVAGFRVEVEVG